ncbi:MAG TPA: hypothetical protein VJ739_18155 [Gemmataceae bacterium]|nr:hypothetical protein [Gemmataceae bacterium]
MSKFPRQPGRRPAAFVPRVEALEGRDLPAPVTYAILPGNVLRVQGTNGADQVVIFDNGTTGVNNVAVVANGHTFLPGVAVTGVLVKTGNGNDSVHYNLIGALVPNASRIVSIDLGAGFNQFDGRLRAGLGTRSTLSLFVNGSSGVNRMSINANADIGSRAALTLQQIGGPGADNLTIDYSGQVAGALTAFASGGAGDDHINQVFTLMPGSAGTLSAEELGGAGNDTLLLADNRVSLFDNTSIATEINGGLGFNKATATSDVTVSNAGIIRL